MDNIKKLKKLLEDSKSILASLELTAKSGVFDKVILELNSMINEIIATFDGNSKSVTYNKMKTAGEHINLILIKGELVLTGVEFARQHTHRCFKLWQQAADSPILKKGTLLTTHRH